MLHCVCVCVYVCVCAQASVLKTAKEYEAAVVEHCFSGAAGDKRENDMENTVSQLKAQLTSVRGLCVCVRVCVCVRARAEFWHLVHIQPYTRAHKHTGRSPRTDTHKDVCIQ